MSDPWSDLQAPSASEFVNARRVDSALTWDFFWAKDMDSSCLLTLAYDDASEPTGHLPTLNDVEVSSVASPDDGRRILLFRLTDSRQKDLFYKLCGDIVDCTRSAEDEKDAVSRAVQRTWRWHHLLRGGRDGRLSQEEQKGLIGELFVLRAHLLPTMSPVDAVEAWRGPLESPKDFELGAICIEAKARRGPARPFVAISSEYQLDPAGTDRLFLHVLEVDRSTGDSEHALTVADAAKKTLDAFATKDPASVEALEALLAASGFRWEDDYSDFRWTEGAAHLYDVCEDFPRICAGDLQLGVGDVKYTISLQECAPYEVGPEVLAAALMEEH